MPGKTKCSTSRKADYLSYKLENKAKKNAELRQLRHQIAHPNDKQKVGTVPDYTPKVKLSKVDQAWVNYLRG